MSWNPEPRYSVIARAYNDKGEKIGERTRQLITYDELTSFMDAHMNPNTGVGVHPECPVVRVYFDIALPVPECKNLYKCIDPECSTHATKQPQSKTPDPQD